MTHPIVYAVTVNWNHPQDTLECLSALRSQVDVDVRLVVVDNGSQDDSVARLRASGEDFFLIETGSNLGFAGGFNTGLRHCLALGAEQVLIINNDTHAHPSMLKELICAGGARTAALAPLIFYANAPEQIWSQGGLINWLLMELSDNHGRGLGIPTRPVEREFLSGCCLLLNCAALAEVGLLDEKFFLYYEDLDWCVRFHQAGWKLKLAPTAKLWHKVSTSSQGSDSANERYWMARSSVIYFRKHVRGAAWLAVIPWRLGSAIKTSVRLLKAGRCDAYRAFWKGLRDGLTCAS